MRSKVGSLRSRVALFAVVALLTAACSSSESSSESSSNTSDVPGGAVTLNVAIGTTDAPTIAKASLAVPAVAQHAAGARDQFFDLPTMTSVGLEPDVRTAAIDVVFALGREMAPFLYAPGWESDGWDVWSSGIEDARVDVPQTVARLAELAAVHLGRSGDHDAEPGRAAWLLDPTVPPPFQGEIITIRWLNGEWIAEGSASEAPVKVPGETPLYMPSRAVWRTGLSTLTGARRAAVP